MGAMSKHPPVQTGTQKLTRVKRVAATLTIIMDSSRVTRAEVAQALGVTPAAVSRFRSGTLSVRYEHLEPLARVLRVPPEAIALPEELPGFPASHLGAAA